VTEPTPVLPAVLARAFDAGRAAAAVRAAAGDATTDVLATEAMVEMAKVLGAAGCLQEPQPKPVELTLEDAAGLLILLARTPKLDGDDVDRVITDRLTYEYAWACVQRTGVTPADADRAHAAQRLLASHHGLR